MEKVAYIDERRRRLLAAKDAGFVFTDRYQALGIPYPDPDTMCHGDCEGVGFFPVYLKGGDRHAGEEGHLSIIGEEENPRVIALWHEAEAKSPADDGWHFVKCPDCDGSGLSAAKTAATKKKLAGEANMVTIGRVGRTHLERFLHSLGTTVYGEWVHTRTDCETLWEDGSIRDAVAYYQGVIKALGRDSKFSITVPVVIREGKLQEPVLFRWVNRTCIFTKEAIEDLFMGMQFPRPMPAREYLFSPPAPPGFSPPSRTMPDPFTGLR